MTLKVKAGDVSAKKWTANAGAAADLYATGAAAAGEDWARNTVAAKSTFKAAITQSGVDERFARGVAKAGAAKYSRKVEAVGKDRFKPGVDAAQPDYQAGVDPYLATMSGLTLVARKPRGDAGNLKRVEQVTTANHLKRLALLGSGA